LNPSGACLNLAAALCKKDYKQIEQMMYYIAVTLIMNQIICIVNPEKSRYINRTRFVFPIEPLWLLKGHILLLLHISYMHF